MNAVLQSVAKTQAYLQDHPYCLVSYTKISEYFRQLGFPDLAAGAGYKALLLADAIEDDSDEYYDAANSDLSDFVSTLPADHEYRCLGHEEQSTAVVLRDVRPSMLVVASHIPSWRNVISS